MLELGDYYTLTERPSRGHRIYRDVWRLLSEGEDTARLAGRAEKMEQAILLQSVDLPAVYGTETTVAPNASLPGFDNGKVTFSYSVSIRGRATNVRLVDAEPAELTDLYAAVGRQLRRVIHRPRHADGVPVKTDDLTFTHTFLYRPEDVPSPKDADAEDTTAD